MQLPYKKLKEGMKTVFPKQKNGNATQTPSQKTDTTGVTRGTLRFVTDGAILPWSFTPVRWKTLRASPKLLRFPLNLNHHSGD